MSSVLRSILMGALTLLIGLLVLQALAYGIGFVLDPEGNAGEFGYATPEPVDELTVQLVRMVGVAMIGGAVLLVLAAILIWRAVPAGAHITLVIGGIYVAVALGAASAGQWWDAGFYGLTGAALIVLAAAVRWLQGRPQSGATGAAPKA